ncbi:hypothetical protein [Anaerorhabdus sp.]|uniref:hypothetical protein n=1 Tax=Anaerorhabdus sp. TaxID=1872524 RepID=UPI002FC8E5D2
MNGNDNKDSANSITINKDIGNSETNKDKASESTPSLALFAIGVRQQTEENPPNPPGNKDESANIKNENE